MKPIHTTTEDCKECKGKGIIHKRISRGNGWGTSWGEICQSCKKGKTTKLIFDAKEFECKNTWRKQTLSKPVGYNIKKHPKECKCKGTGYILPKKGDVREVKETDFDNNKQPSGHSSYYKATYSILELILFYVGNLDRLFLH